MKVAVYAISKNEAKFVQRWHDAIRLEADHILVLDTGSTDDTVQRMRDTSLEEGCPITVHQAVVSPWRFDDARNISLALLPADIDVCICLDLDEIIQPGWRAALEKAWIPGTTRLRYPYTWNWTKDGKPGVVYYADKIHARKGRWKLPCHEVLHLDVDQQEFTDALQVHHHADATKSRSSYLPLLEIALKEAPDDSRTLHYLGREYFFHGQYQQSWDLLVRHAEMSGAWTAERARSCYYLSQMNPHSQLSWLLRGIALEPTVRETWFDLAWYLRSTNENGWIWAACRALDIPEDSAGRTYLSNPLCYDGTLERWINEHQTTQTQ